MRRIAIIYFSRYGQTEKIAARLAAMLELAGSRVHLCNLRDSAAVDISGTDGVLIGGPIYVGRSARELIDWTKENRTILQLRNCGLFTVSLNAADPRPAARKDDTRLLEEFLGHTGLRPDFVASFGGALKYQRYWLPLRLLMKRISRSAGGPLDTTRDHELTDWTQVNAFAKAFATEDHSSPFALEKRFPRFVPTGDVYVPAAHETSAALE